MAFRETYQVLETFIKTKIGRRNQINTSEIKQIGRFPVIDQGQTFIAGYCDEESKVIREELPLVIFGDHTRCFKFVDFPFIIGADGTKVLKPREELFDPKFYYFALLSLKIPSRGYNKHFKFLKEQEIPRPLLSEQKKIAHILSTVQQAIEQQERLIALTTELKKALMHKLFTEGLRGEPQKETEIGLVPESWEVVKLGELAKKPEGRIQTGPFGSQLHKDEYQNSGIPVINPTHLIGNRINHDDVPRIAPKKAEELGRHKLIAELFDLIEKKLLIIEKRKTQYQDLFRTILHQLMTAQIRVHELEGLQQLVTDVPEEKQMGFEF